LIFLHGPCRHPETPPVRGQAEVCNFGSDEASLPPPARHRCLARAKRGRSADRRRELHIANGKRCLKAGPTRSQRAVPAISLTWQQRSESHAALTSRLHENVSQATPCTIRSIPRRIPSTKSPLMGHLARMTRPATSPNTPERSMVQPRSLQ